MYEECEECEHGYEECEKLYEKCGKKSANNVRNYTKQYKTYGTNNVREMV